MIAQWSRISGLSLGFLNSWYLAVDKIACSISLLGAIFVFSFAAAAASLNPADAAQSQDREALQALVRQHVNLDATQADGSTALQWAAHWNDLESVKLLLRAGANPKLANRCRKPLPTATLP